MRLKQVVFGSPVKDPAGKRVISSYTETPKSGIEIKYHKEESMVVIKEKEQTSLYPLTNVKQMYPAVEKKRGRPAADK